jgi:hypothetical protein
MKGRSLKQNAGEVLQSRLLEQQQMGLETAYTYRTATELLILLQRVEYRTLSYGKTDTFKRAA